MAEFRRLISYIYEYEGNVKGKNVGFVKLEARNGMCRLSVSVKKLYIGSSDMGVYLLTGRQEIFLGNLFLRNGCGEFRTVVQLADVQESGETMDECYGLTLHGKSETWRVYTTIWEDAVAQAAQLTLENVTSENAVEREVESGRLSSVVPELPARDKGAAGGTGTEERRAEERKTEESESAGGTEAEANGPADDAPALGAPESDAPGPDRPEVRVPAPGAPEAHTSGPGTPKIDGLGPKAAKKEMAEKHPSAMKGLTIPEFLGIAKPERPVSGQPARARVVEFRGKNVHTPSASDLPKKEAHEPEISLPDHEMGRLEMETAYPDIPLEKAAASGLFSAPAAEEDPPMVIRQHVEEPLIIGDPQALARLDEQEAMEKLVPVWDFFADTYPKIQAFDSEHGCQVLVIKPQDIGLLPRETWIYGNNSFLLHGYYNYRYLILARLENPRGLPRYLLGVPGHYYSNEKYMASMFGFPHFVLSKRQPAQDGRFGYWYTDIRMEEDAVLGAAAVEKAKKMAY